MSEKHLIWQYGAIRCADRERLNGYYFVVVWFTGLSGAGKSTLAHAVEQALYEQHILCLELDGDNIRHGLCSDLGFSPNHRRENLRRVSEAAKLAREASCSAPIWTKDRMHPDSRL